MSAGDVVPGSLGGEVGKKRGILGLVHPVVGIRSGHAVLGVLVRALRRNGRFVRGGHGGQRTAGRLVAVLALLLGAVGVGLTAPGPASAAAPKKPVTFTVALLESVDSFNPFNGINSEAYEMWYLTYDYMTGWSMKDMSPTPALATKWTTAPNGLTWTFTIRKGVKWSDGVPLTAADIAYTYNRVLHGSTEQASWISYLKGVTSVTAPNATTVVLKLKKPNAVLPDLPIPILPEHIWKNVSEKQVKSYSGAPTNGQPVVGSGPFRLVSGTAGGSTYVFKRNPHYWGGEPHVDQIVFRVYNSADPAIQALQKGEVDFVEGISAIQVRALQGKPGITAHNGDSPGFEEIAFNTGSVDTKTGKPIGNPNPALRDPKFRHALGYALNLKQIIAKAFQGAGQPGTTIVPPAYKGYHWQPPKSQLMTFNLKKAGDLLDEAGYKMGSNGLRTMPDGKPIGTLRLYARTESPSSLDTLTFFKEWLSDLGINSAVSSFENAKLTNIILEGNYDIFEWGWYVEPNPDSMLSYMTCGQRGDWSDSWYCNPAYDKLYNEQHSEMNQAKRVAEIKKMQEILYRDSPYLVTTYDTQGEAVRSDRFACFEPQPNPGGVWLYQYGAHNYISVRPAADAGDCDGVADAIGAKAAAPSHDVGKGFLVGGGVVIVLLLALGGFFGLRRRSTVGDRE